MPLTRNEFLGNLDAYLTSIEPTPDWSSLMTQVMKSLGQAESHLRLQHMDPKNKETAIAHLLAARAQLLPLIDWCERP